LAPRSISQSDETRIPFAGTYLAGAEVEIMQKRKQRGFSLIELLIVVAIIGIIAAIAIPNLLKSQQAAREVAAIKELQAIRDSEVMYSITKGHRKYTDLATLGANGFIDSALASGNKGGYIFTAVAIEGDGMQSMFEATARPSNPGTFGTGNRSYYMNETNVVYEADGGTPPTATPQDRIPKDGQPIQ
jgi:prepilin-type N-terminal cleavage/methylation domain-containing protein